MAWDRRKLAALAVCSVAYLSLLSCRGAEFSSSDAGGDSGSGGGGKTNGMGGKSSSPAGSDTGAAAGRGGAMSTGGDSNPGGAGDPNPGSAGEEMGSAGQPAVGPVIPKEGLLYWFAGDVGVTQEQGVKQWANQAGGGGDAVQLLPELQPKLTETGLAPLPFLEFDGVDDYMELPETNASFAGGLSMFIVAGSLSSAGCSGYIELSNGGEINDVHVGVHEGALQYEVQDQSLRANSAIPTGELVLAEAHHGGAVDEAPAELRVNGVQDNSSVLTLPASLLRVANFLGRTLYGSCSPYSGAMAELILYTRRVTAEERAQIELYLLTKWECCN